MIATTAAMLLALQMAIPLQCRDGSIERRPDGTVASCAAKYNAIVVMAEKRSLTCAEGSTATFHPNGNLASCKLLENVDLIAGGRSPTSPDHLNHVSCGKGHTATFNASMHLTSCMNPGVNQFPKVGGGKIVCAANQTVSFDDGGAVKSCTAP